MSTPAHSHKVELDSNPTRCRVVEDDRATIVNNATADFSVLSNQSTHNDVVAQLRAAAKGTGPYLDGCTIYVVDFDGCDELKRVLNTSGAVQLNQLCNGVTHVIVTKEKLPKHVLVPKQVHILEDLDPMPYLVTSQWLLESAKHGKPADEELFKFETVIPICEEGVVPPAQLVQETPSISIAQSSGSMERLRSSDPTTTADSNNNDSYLSTTLTETEQNPRLFAGITFKVVLLDAAERELCEKVIVDYGGILTQQNPEVMILPIICDKRAKDEADQLYTKYWLSDVLGKKSLNVARSFHYVPMVSFKRMSEVMKCSNVASEREYVVELLKAMGGRYQVVFAKKDATDRKHLRSTHLVCKSAETEKANAAKRWDVPVVVIDWIVDCFSQKKRLSEHLYHPENQRISEPSVYMATPETLKRKGGPTEVIKNQRTPKTKKGTDSLAVVATSSTSQESNGQESEEDGEESVIYVTTIRKAPLIITLDDTNTSENGAV